MQSIFVRKTSNYTGVTNNLGATSMHGIRSNQNAKNELGAMSNLGRRWWHVIKKRGEVILGEKVKQNEACPYTN